MSVYQIVPENNFKHTTAIISSLVMKDLEGLSNLNKY